jgi:hypothetical protein
MLSEKPPDEPADFAGFRARRAALKEERRRQKARDNFTGKAPDPCREIPPRLNPDVPDMVDRVKACYVGLTQWMTDFERGIVNLADAGMLNRCVSLSGHSRDLKKAVDAAMADALKWHPAAKLEDVHRLADHAKYAYAVGSRDIAALQYRLAELAGTGRIDHNEQGTCSGVTACRRCGKRSTTAPAPCATIAPGMECGTGPITPTTTGAR